MATSTLGSGTLVLAGTTSGTTTVTATAVAGTTTLTLPAATDTLVGKATTDTLTNKTLTGAVMNGTLGATTPSTVAATTISASSTATFAAGAAGTPSITTSGDTNTGIFFPAADTIAFAEGGAEVARFDSSGNFGLGVTPSAFTRKAFQLGDAAAAYVANNSGGATVIATNMYFDGSNKYATTAAAARYSVGTGTHEWYTAASGTAGNAITFTQAMTLDASGNLGVGTTSPLGKIHVTDASATNGALFERTTATTTGPRISSRSLATSSGDMADTFGPTHAFAIQDTAAVINPIAEIGAARNGADNTGNLIFRTYSAGTATTNMTLDSSGNLLVGTTTGASSTSALMQLKKGGVQWDTGPNGSNGGFNVLKDGTTGVYLTSGATAWSGLSDETMKDIIEPIENASQKISTLRTVIGKYKTDEEGTRRAFLIAQDVKEVLPEAVNENENGKLGLQYTDVMPLLVAAIKEQQALITQLTARITALESA